MRLKDIRQVASHADRMGQRVTVKLSDDKIYELLDGKVFDQETQMGVINGKETEIRHFQPLSRVWKDIKTMKVGNKMVALLNEEGELIFKEESR